MSGIIAIMEILSSNATVVMILAGIAAFAGALIRGRRAGAAAERARQAERERKARATADEVDNDIGAMPPDEARKELSKWSRP